MATLVIGIESGYQWVTPTTDAEIIELAQQYIAQESKMDAAAQLAAPALSDVRAALTTAQGGLENARREENRRAESATEFHRAQEQATPLLAEAFEQLKWRQRDNLSRLQQWGLKTKTGVKGKVLVTKPRTEQEWAAFLQEFVAKEASLPEAERVMAGNLLPLQDLAAVVRSNQVERASAQSARKLAVETRLVTAGPLLDLLQLAFGVLVVTRFERRVTTALEAWGFKIRATPSKNAAAAAPDPVDTPAVEMG
jgi:hypothetical protein